MAGNDLGPQLIRPLHRDSQTASFQSATSNTGLWYDKFCNAWHGPSWTRFDQIKVAKLDWIQTVTRQPVGSSQRLTELSTRQATLAKSLGGQSLVLTTATRFATGLGREHPVENGFAWHHSLGTPYLAGSSVKGLLRAFVREWIDGGQTLADQIFGNDRPFHVGELICFDAIPTQPVQLEADVMTPHYGPYYQGKEAPGDWHSPTPIPFLVVAKEQPFQFAFAPRRSATLATKPDGSPVTIDTVTTWLRDALHWLGAGAKTNTGYGVFRSPDQQPSAKPSTTPPATRLEFQSTLELITPAFLAGADQQHPADCDLRPSTLRGQLRWWWRTMHAGFVDVPTLRALEAAIWGDTSAAGALRLVVKSSQKGTQIPFPGKHVAKNKNDQDVLRLDPAFAKAHQLKRAPEKRTQGVLYLSFGMDEMPAGKLIEREQRTGLLPGATWELTMVARGACYSRPGIANNERPRRIPASLIRQQAMSALWLLCEFGGVGSKGRNGFGCLNLKTDQPLLTLEGVKQAAITLRKEIGISDSVRVPSELSSLENMLLIEPIKTLWKNYWFVFDQLGFSIQDFCQAEGHKRTWIKEALGLPRKIGRSDNDGVKALGYSRTFDKQTQQEVVWLGQKHPHLGDRDPKDMRHASPIHYHLNRDPDGAYSIRVVAFPSAVLPDATTSKSVLAALLDHLKNNLASRVDASPSSGTSVTTTPPSPNQPPPRATAISVPEKTLEQLKQRLAGLPTSQVLLKVEGPNPLGGYKCQKYRLAPNTASGIGQDGHWTLLDAPSLNAETIVVTELASEPKRGKFVEVFGRLPTRPQSSPNRRK